MERMPNILLGILYGENKVFGKLGVGSKRLLLALVLIAKLIRDLFCL